MFICIGRDLMLEEKQFHCNFLRQECQTHFHWGPHQSRGCLQRAECNLGLCTCNCSLMRGKELRATAGQKQGAGPDTQGGGLGLACGPGVCHLCVKILELVEIFAPFVL